MRVNKYFFGLIFSALIASICYAIQIKYHSDRYDDLRDMPTYLQLAIIFWWVALINVAIWLTASCIAFGRYLSRMNRP